MDERLRFVARLLDGEPLLVTMFVDSAMSRAVEHPLLYLSPGPDLARHGLLSSSSRG